MLKGEEWKKMETSQPRDNGVRIIKCSSSVTEEEKL